MSKLDVLTIAIVIVCLAALGYLVYKIVNLVNPPEETTTSIADSYSADTADDTYTDWDDDTTTGDDADLDDDQVNSYGDTDDVTTPGNSFTESEMDNSSTGTAETDDLEEEEEPAPAPSTTSTAPTRPAGGSTAVAAENGGRYMVIAGTYRQRANADNQVARLRKMGYDDARVSLFDNGTYALALVQRFNSYGDAKRLVTELQGKGVDALIDEK